MMRRLAASVLALVICVGFAPASADAYQVISDFFQFPVVVYAPGAGGTSWNTEVCVGNPQETTLRISGCLTATGGVVGCGYFDIPARSETCVANMLGYLGLSGKGSLWLNALPEDNPHTSNLGFLATAMVYNDSPTGRFGQDIPAVTLGTQYGVLFNGEQALIPALHNFGPAGGDGARSNVGFVNLSDRNAPVDLYLYDSQGRIVWTNRINLKPYELKQFTVPAAGFTYTMGIQTWGEAIVAYGSVVDNKTGDGVLRTTFLATGFMPTVQAPEVAPEEKAEPQQDPPDLRELANSVFEQARERGFIE